MNIRLIELSDGEKSEICADDILIKSIPVDHWIPCLSYSIELKSQGKFDVERAKKLALTEPEKYVETVRTIFANTIAGSDLLIKTIKYMD